MRVLVACEYSAIVRDAFLRHGHDAWSCDLRETEGNPDRHHIGDVLPLLRDSWDLVIAHPPCTYLTNAGVRWLWEDCKDTTKQERWLGAIKAAKFFVACLQANAKRVAVENPRMHPYGVEMIGRDADQFVQPWQFGHGETKGIGLWLKNLPKLRPTEVVEGREARVHKMGPGPEREKERSRFYTGVADAMADQWGRLSPQAIFA